MSKLFEFKNKYVLKSFFFFLSSLITTVIFLSILSTFNFPIEASNVLTNPSFTGGSTSWTLGSSIQYSSSYYQDSAGSIEGYSIGRKTKTSGTAEQTISSQITGGSTVTLSLYWSKQCVSVNCDYNYLYIDVAQGSNSYQTVWSNTTSPSAGSATAWASVSNVDISSYFTNTDTYKIRIYTDLSTGNDKNAAAYAWVDNMNLDVTAPMPTLTVGSSGTQTSSVEASTTDFYLGGAFTFVIGSSTSSITSITIDQTGSISDSDISGLILYYKQEASCSTSIPGDATQFNSTPGSFSSGSSTVTGSMSVGTTQTCVYAEIDIGSGASNGDTIDIQITDPTTDVTASYGNLSPATAITISGTTTVQVQEPPTFTVFSDDGPKDPGDTITFTATSSDPNGDDVFLVICYGGDEIDGITCPQDDDVCTSSTAASNPSCQYQIPSVTFDGPHYIVPYVFDINNNPSESSLQGVETSFTINNVAPVVSNVTINGGSAIDLIAGSTKSVDITATITDNNSCYEDEISDVSAYAYRSGIGGTGGTDIYYFDASVSGPTDTQNVWDNEANAFDGLTTTDATTSDYDTVVETNVLTAIGTNAPSTGGVVTQVRVRVYAQGGWALGYYTLSEPTGGWTWEKVQNLEAVLHVTYDLISPNYYYAIAIIKYSGTQLGSSTLFNISSSTPWTFSRVEIEVTSSGDPYLACDTSGEADNNYCYPEITCSTTDPCYGYSTASRDYTCTVNLQYYADPTDSNTQYPDEYWMSTIKATDDNSATDDAEVSAGVKLNSLTAFNITTAVNYGALGINQSNDPLDRTTLITPTGNVGLDNEVSGPTYMCTDFPTCSGYTIDLGYQKYALSSSTAYTSATSLTTTPTETETNIAKPITATPTGKNIWWGILIPDGTNPGSYDGAITVTGIKGETADW